MSVHSLGPTLSPTRLLARVNSRQAQASPAPYLPPPQGGQITLSLGANQGDLVEYMPEAIGNQFNLGVAQIRPPQATEREQEYAMYRSASMLRPARLLAVSCAGDSGRGVCLPLCFLRRPATLDRQLRQTMPPDADKDEFSCMPVAVSLALALASYSHSHS